MPREDNTTFALPRIVLAQLRELAIKDKRSAPSEISWLVQNELARRARSGAYTIQDLPHPEGGEVVPLVLVKGKRP